LGERDQLLVQTRDLLAGVDPENGTVFWKQPIEAFRGMNILTPVVVDGRLFTSAYGGKTQGWTVSARSGDAWEVREDWSLRLEGYMSTPVVDEGHAYLLARNQRLMCVEVATGKKRWESSEKFGKYMSLVRQGRRILGLDQRGVLYLFEADPSAYRTPLERRVADAESWAHVAVEGNDVVIREQEAVALWDWRTPGTE
jgi:outer membrane protein assembly factor BamB